MIGEPLKAGVTPIRNLVPTDYPQGLNGRPDHQTFDARISPTPMPRVSTGSSAATTSTPRYVIGTIPPKEVLAGSTLTFDVLASTSDTAHFSYTLDANYPTPKGTITLTTLDGVSARFTYESDAEDAFEFLVVVSVTVPGSPVVSQTVAITPVQTLPPETDLIQRTPSIPDPASTDYLLVTQSQNSAPELFNGIQQTTWTVEISGKSVIFDSGSPDFGNLYTRFNNRPDVKQIIIYAETLTIRSQLKLPGTNVSVFTRYLKFEDPNGPATIDTTPVGPTTSAGQFQNGLPGQKGGDITLHIQNFQTQPGPTVRLITGGSAGQDAGQGRSGNPKPDLVPAPPPAAGNGHPFSWIMRWSPPVGRVVLDWPFTHQGWGWVLQANGQPLPQSGPYPVVVYVQAPPQCGAYTAGAPIWPADGEDAVAPGIPGLGGAGGIVSSTLQNVSSAIQVSGGMSGQAASGQSGAPAQRPVFSAWLNTIDGSRCGNDYFNFQIRATHTAAPGHDAPSIPPAQPTGPDGSFSLLPDQDSLSWLHPNMLRWVMTHAKDAYRTGNLQFAQGVFQDYVALLGTVEASTGSLTPEFQQARDEMQGLLHRLANNLDYFGHSAGWVPLLSLEATMTAFSNEVDAVVPVLFLSQWLQEKATQNVKDITALKDAMAKLSDEASAARSDADAAIQSIPDLQQQAAQLSADLQNFEVLLQQREAALLQQAQNDVVARQRVPAWKKALRVLGTVAQTIPVYQPALGVIGQGLDFVVNFDTSQPLQSLQNRPNITSLFKSDTWTQSEQSYDTFLKSVDFRSFQNAESFASELNDAYTSHAALIKQTMQMLQTDQISNTDVQREFDQLLKTDAIFQDLSQQVADLQTRKQTLVQALTNTTQEIANDQSVINSDLLSVAASYQTLNTTAAQFDHATASYVRDMDHRARERLLRYQYYMAKAYEYRMLQPYPGDLNVDSVVTKIIEIMATDGYAALLNPGDLSAIKAVYLDSVRQIVSAALTQLEAQPPERSLPFYFNLTPAQLNHLNQTGQLTLDLAPLIAGTSTEDNRHIADLAVAAMTVQPQGPIGPVARVRLLIDHDGQSTETLNGRRYNFYLGNGPNDRPFTWGASFTLPNGPLSQETNSVAGLSLLTSLLNLNGSSDALALFARPGADAVVSLTKVQDPPSLNAPITSVQIAVTVDFYRGTTSRARLNVQSNQTGSPYIRVSQTDITGRQDGTGSFGRTYTAGQTVTLTAEPRYGRERFIRWVDGSGQTLGTSATIQLTMTKDLNVQAMYAVSNVLNDFDNDGQSDISVFRRSDGTWLIRRSTDETLESVQWGAPQLGDIPVPGDYDGDGETDIAVYRSTSGQWFIQRSSDGTLLTQNWGAPSLSDVPVPGDYDGDGKTDIAIYRKTTGQWFILRSSDGGLLQQSWGSPALVDRPVPGDYDGDGKTDIAVYRTTTGQWYIRRSSDNTLLLQNWGAPSLSDVPVPGDYDGDGKTDIAVYRTTTGQWYIRRSSDNTTLVQAWGAPTLADLPVPDDYDGDGKTDIAVYRSTTGQWYIQLSSTGALLLQNWGAPSLMDIPTHRTP
jgi:hypothetical protein